MIAARTLASLLLALALAGCAPGIWRTVNVSDLAPGVPRGVQEAGYDKTTQGLSRTVRGYAVEDVWAAAARATQDITRGRGEANISVEVVERRPPERITLQGRDRWGTCCVYVVGVFIKPQAGGAVEIEVNQRHNILAPREFCPCEADYLRAIERELAKTSPTERRN
jgi:hypothetical protein